MQTNPPERAGYLPLLFAFLILLLLGAVVVFVLKPSAKALTEVSMVLSGMFAMATLDAFQRYLDSSRKGPFIQIVFNEQMATASLEQAAERIGIDTVDELLLESKHDEKYKSWEIQAEDLLGQDNALALAKVRIDLERELHRLAESAGLRGLSRLGIRRLTDELQRRKILDPSLTNVINDIIPAANQAIHGKIVSEETASSIVAMSRRVLGLLRATSQGAVGQKPGDVT